MVLIEAMACGLPVISTLSGSIPEVVGDAGILVQSNDPRGLSTAIISLLKDDAVKKELSIKGRERAINDFNSQKIAYKFKLLFEELVQSSFRGDVEESADLVAEIDATIAKERFSEARGIIESYLEIHPLDLSSLVKYAEVCFKLSDYDTALDNLDKVLLFNKDTAGAVELKRKIESYAAL